MTKQNYTELFQKMLAGFCLESDPISAMMEWLANQVMEAEVSLKTNVEKGAHSDDRKTHRNGYRARRWDTRLGSIHLLIPKVRSGGYNPFFLIQKQRSEAALMLVVQEAYINGVSTRKMQQVLSSFGIENISASEVSRMTKELQGQVDEYRTKSLNDCYPVVWIDALYEKVRVEGKVVSMAMMIAIGLDKEGKRHILAIEPMENESKDTWKIFFEKLKARGLTLLPFLVSDAHAGIQAALKGVFIGTTWQRCKVHFMRNILTRISHHAKSKVAADIKLIFNQDSFKDAIQLSKEVIKKYGDKFPESMDVLAAGVEDSLQFLHFSELPKNRVSSTNHLERLNREIRRRSKVVGVFPSKESFLRLIGSYLIEYEEGWSMDRAYIQSEKILNLQLLKAA